MQRTLKAVLHAMAATGLALLMGAAQAQSYPQKPVTLIVGYVPGGGPDMIARILAEELSKELGQPFVVQNRPGAGGTLATAQVANMAPDGYNLLLGETGQLEIAPFLFKELPYKVPQDFTPIGLVERGGGLVLVSNAKTSNIRNIDEFIAAARAHPETLNYASSGIGTIHQISMEAFLAGAGIKATHIPYKGSGQSSAALLAGDVPVAMTSLTGVEQHIRSGAVNLLGITSLNRSAVFPDAPSLAEVAPGYEGFVSEISLLGPAGLPAEVVKTLSEATRRVLAKPHMQPKLEGTGMTFVWTSPEDYKQHLEKNLAKFERAIKAANIQAQ